LRRPIRSGVIGITHWPEGAGSLTVIVTLGDRGLPRDQSSPRWSEFSPWPEISPWWALAVAGSLLRPGSAWSRAVAMGPIATQVALVPPTPGA